MTTCLGKSCLFELLCMPFVNVFIKQIFVLLSLLIFRMDLTVLVPNQCLSFYFYIQLFYL